MARRKEFLDIDVLTAAKQRIHHIYDIFDSVVVCFSGGKDSTVVLNLVWEVAQERGIDHVNVAFFDEEMIQDEVIDFVDSYRQKPWVRMLWYCYPLASRRLVLGRAIDCTWWDPAREWVREMPAWGIKPPPGETKAFSQHTLNAVVASNFRGKVAMLNGIRAAESMFRYHACMRKLNENYINASQDPTAKNINVCKPIFDWSEDDVFKFFYDRQIPYCTLYDAQLWGRNRLRVATPITPSGARELSKLKSHSPRLYAGIIRVMPDMILQERYDKERDRKSVDAKYSQSWDTILQWINENLQGGQLAEALKEFRRVKPMGLKRPHMFPLSLVLKFFVEGDFRRRVRAVPPSSMTKKQREEFAAQVARQKAEKAAKEASS